LDEALRHGRELLAAVEVCESSLVTVPDDHDFTDVELAGFARAGVEALRTMARGADDAAAAARDALALLVRLAEAKP